jgi:uncharacterized protein YegL
MNKKKETGLKSMGFPKNLTAEMLRRFITADRGSTHPRVGEINGKEYIAKCGAWSTYSSDEHVLNELKADEFLRKAGFNVPASREYTVDFGRREGKRIVRLAEFKADTIPLAEAWEQGDEMLRVKIREQVVASYPVQAIIAGIDTYKYDNIRVDRDGNLWFVDNGASFDFRARGHKKGWFFYRDNPLDPKSGYMSLARHRDQGLLRRILGGVDEAALWNAAARLDIQAVKKAFPNKLLTRPVIKYINDIVTIAVREVKNPRPVKTELVFILDRSGSMSGVEQDVITGFNNLLAKQKRENGECFVTTVLFDDRISVLHNRTAIRDVEPITTREYTIGGMTALYDALGGAVARQVMLQRTLPNKEKADKVVFAIITDGYENSSCKYSADAVRKMVKYQTEEWGWEFLFLGANIEAAEVAKDIGVAAERAVDFVCDGGGLGLGYDAVDRAVRNVRNRRRVEDADDDGRSWRDQIDRDYQARK